MYTALRALLARELEEVGKTVVVCEERMARLAAFSSRGEEDILADSVASCMHSFYTGLENIFSTIAEEVDEGMPKGDRWHKQLLLLMSSEVAGVRPPVISQMSLDKLDEFRTFRHLFRNLYAHNLLTSRVFALAAELPSTWDMVSNDVRRFLDFLGEL